MANTNKPLLENFADFDHKQKCINVFTIAWPDPQHLVPTWQYQSVHSCTNLPKFIGGASFWVLGHDLQGAIQYVIKRRRLSQLSLKIEVTIMLKFQGRQIKIRPIGRASPSAQHAKEWKHCLLVLFNVQWINCLAFKRESAQIKSGREQTEQCEMNSPTSVSLTLIISKLC